ncbi:hypothetical protein XACN24_11580 [Xanthomonas albilineans]|uniref:Uncharacterized protein n=1 Tax=Xanthomonas albilineans (strain GPE PC73 / CFBP 7063) TaxID=380358 RepID=D2U9B3_XANAP|nr:hypothetical protein [Xanthomonas albilineans]CBA16855.1 hypothetical protein XALC_2375 [Xanthomonas albilineans GPE PC73]
MNLIAGAEFSISVTDDVAAGSVAVVAPMQYDQYENIIFREGFHILYAYFLRFYLAFF